MFFLLLGANPESDRVKELLVVDDLSESTIFRLKFWVICKIHLYREILGLESFESIVDADKLL